jgi:cytochrome c oxidase subunit 2
MAEEGESLFRQLGCAQCHTKDGHGRAPNLYGAYGMKVDLSDGSSVRFDEAYIRESVLYPQAKIVAGYDRIMPTFKGLISDEGMLKLIEYIKSLGDPNGVIPERTLEKLPSDIQKTGPMALPESEYKTPAAAGKAPAGGVAGNQATGKQQ